MSKKQCQYCKKIVTMKESNSQNECPECGYIQFDPSILTKNQIENLGVN